MASHWIEASYVVISSALAYHKHVATIEAKRSRDSSDELWHIRRHHKKPSATRYSFYLGIISSSQQYRTINKHHDHPRRSNQLRPVPNPFQLDPTTRAIILESLAENLLSLRLPVRRVLLAADHRLDLRTLLLLSPDPFFPLREDYISLHAIDDTESDEEIVPVSSNRVASTSQTSAGLIDRGRRESR